MQSPAWQTAWQLTGPDYQAGSSRKRFPCRAAQLLACFVCVHRRNQRQAAVAQPAEACCLHMCLDGAQDVTDVDPGAAALLDADAAESHTDQTDADWTAAGYLLLAQSASTRDQFQT